MEEEAAWRNQLKVGDTVVVDSGYGIRDLVLAKVTRATATQIDAGHQTFKRENGWRRGGSGYHSAYLREPTPERVHVIRRAHAVNRLRDVRWFDKPDSLVFAVVSLLAESESTTKPDSPSPSEALTAAQGKKE